MVFRQHFNQSPLLDMFFRVPKKKAGPDYKYHEVVRKRHERQKLEAYTCYQCEEVRIIKLEIVLFFVFFVYVKLCQIFTFSLN